MSLSEAARIFARVPLQLQGGELKAHASKVRRVVILSTLWYPEVMNPLVESAKTWLMDVGVSQTALVHWQVPGSFELPLGFKQSLPADFVIALGCVVRGETPHFDFVCSACSHELMRLQCEHSTPLGFGVLTVDSLEQAKKRLDKGAEAAQAAFLMYLNARVSLQKKDAF